MIEKNDIECVMNVCKLMGLNFYFVAYHTENINCIMESFVDLDSAMNFLESKNKSYYGISLVVGLHEYK